MSKVAGRKRRRKAVPGPAIEGYAVLIGFIQQETALRWARHIGASTGFITQVYGTYYAQGARQLGPEVTVDA
jgi:hypothetical protein